MVDKEPRLTSKQIQADLQTQGTTMSARTIRRLLNEKGRYGRRPKRTPLLTQMQKSKTGVCQSVCDKTTILRRKRIVDRWDKKNSFLVKNIMALFTEKKRTSKKSTQSLQSNMVEVQRWFGVASGTGCLDRVNSIMKSTDYQIILGRNIVATFKKLRTPP